MIVDIECDIPTREVCETDLEHYLSTEDEGMANYLNIFGPQWAQDAGMSLTEFEDRKQSMAPMALRREIAARAVETAPTEAAFLRMLDDDHGIQHGQVDVLPGAGLLAMVQRCEDGDGRVQRGTGVGYRRRIAGGLMRLVAVHILCGIVDPAPPSRLFLPRLAASSI